MTGQTTLVTGAAGFIGSHLAERLLQDGRTVIGIDCFNDNYPRALKERNLRGPRGYARFQLIEADLASADLEAVFKRADAPMDYVFHLAGQPGVRTSWGRDFETYARNNVLATQRLLEAVKSGALKKFVYASSSSIYGDAEKFPTSEDALPRPVSPYGVTKLAGEHLVFAYGSTCGIPVVTLRYFTVYGPRQRPDMAFHCFIHAIQRGEEIVVYGDGEQTRSFTFVGDVVEGTLRAGLSGVVGDVFNIGGGSQVSVKQVIEILQDIMGQRARVRYSASQRGDVRHTGADIRRATRELGYAPVTLLEEGLRRQVEAVRAESVSDGAAV